MGHKKVRVAIAQINTTVGDLDGNAQKILDYVEKARAAGADIVSFPELAVCGYPPEDLLLKHAFIRDNLDALSTLVKKIGDIVAVIGFADKAGREVYNAAAVVYDKKIRKVYHKILLPNYGVFDEKRYFAPGRETPVFVMDGIVFAVNICEDIWHDEGPTRPQAKKGARLIVNINSSPYHAGKIKLRQRIVRRQAVGNKVFVSYTNLVGGQDELVFDGQSMILDNRGRRVALAKAFEEDLLVEDLDIPAQIRAKAKFFRDAVVIPKEIRYEEKPPLSKREPYCLKPLDEVYRALILGLKDYISKNGFERVIIGLSGGIDSSLTATIAVDALGRDAVCGVFMPSVYTSRESKEDVQKLALVQDEIGGPEPQDVVRGPDDGKGGDGDHAGFRGYPEEPPLQFHPGAVGEELLAEDEIGGGVGDDLKGLRTVVGQGHPEARVGEKGRQHVPDARLVVDDQDRFLRHGVRSLSPPGGYPRRSFRRAGGSPSSGGS